MSLKYHAALFSLLLLLFLASTATAESLFRIPCDPELSPFLSSTEHTITHEIDLKEEYRMAIDYWGNEVMLVDSGSLIILDDQFVIISLRFSKDFDYEAHDAYLPEEIVIANHDLHIADDTNPPEWRVTVYPDEDDPYSFHYIGSWNPTMYCFQFHGNHTDQHGERVDDFGLHVDI